MKKIYVGMALSDAPSEFRDDFQHELKGLLREIPGVEILDFVGVENGTARNVYRHDRYCTESADLAVFVTDYASTGLGMEIWIRRMTQKPMLLVANRSRKISRMLVGFAEEEDVPFVRYDSATDVVKVVRETLKI